MAHSGEEGGPRQKALLFVTEGIMAKKDKEGPDSISKASTHACGVGIYFYFIRPSIISFDGHRILICTLGAK